MPILQFNKFACVFVGIPMYIHTYANWYVFGQTGKKNTQACSLIDCIVC